MYIYVRGAGIATKFVAHLEASISTRLAGSPSKHLLQCATWPVLLSAGREPARTLIVVADAIGVLIKIP